MEITSLALCFLAFVALALAMDRHHGQVLNSRPSPRFRRFLRSGGWALIMLSAAPCIAASGWSIGLTWWLGILTAAAMPVLLLLTYRPKTLPTLAAACPLVALAPFLIQF
ncbi:MAG: DUF3325 domain-containing protein [Sphingobium limneticum]